MRLQDKVASIAGAISGIDKDIAKTFCREGAKVCIADLKLEAAQAAVDEIEKDGGTAIAVAMDVTNEGQVNAGVQQTMGHFGRYRRAGEQCRYPAY
jgi:3-hydroxybutyrate dehydrogenase